MNKAAIYISLLFLTVLSIHLYVSYTDLKEVALKGDGLQFVNMTKKEIISDVDKDIIFIVKDFETKVATLYKVKSYVGGGKYDFLRHPIGFQYGSQPNYFIQAMNGEIVFTDTLYATPKEEIQQLVFDAPKIEALKLIQHREETDLFSFIDNSFFVFFALAFIWMIGLFVLHIPMALSSIRYKGYVRNIVIFLATALGIRFLQVGFTPTVFPVSQWIIYVKPIVIIFPIYFIYQWLFVWKNRNLDFEDEEAFKFAIIFIGGLITIYIANIVCANVTSDQTIMADNYKMYLGLGFSFALGNLMFNVVRYFYKLRFSSKELAIAEKKVAQSESEFNALQSSVNPHFLYNALNSISALAIEDPKRTQKMTLALSEFYKYNTNRGEKPWTTVSEEVAMLESYLEIEKIRFEDRLIYDLQFDGSCKDKAIPHFLLQPLVENAVKHGYNNKTDNIDVKVEIIDLGDQLEISILDSGKPFDENLRKGYGLKSVSKKLKAFFPDSHEFEFINLPTKRIRIRINVQND